MPRLNPSKQILTAEEGKSLRRNLSVDAHYWPSCRVVIQGFNDQSIVKVEFIVIDEGEVPQGYGYAGTVVHTNPKYRAHFAFKVIYIND